ncbi:MAG: type II toxin-antitoxin system YafQ family toxin [Opitutales bacterium]|nr:type II toxin-antitoxin system YafQ family toxin [Opitutales bacterium]
MFATSGLFAKITANCDPSEKISPSWPLSSTLWQQVAGENLAEKYRDHALIGNYQGCRECHVSPDWLLIYQTTETELILVRTGSHSVLFG